LIGHTYSTDSHERERVLLGLALLAIGAAWGLSELFHVTKFVVPWWIDAPSTLGFYGIFFKLFDSYGWRIDLLRRTGILEVPVLAGEWRGHVVSSFDGHKKPHRVTVQIKQSWTRVVVLLSSDTSRSHTLTAAIEVYAPEGVVLSYQYENQPQPGAVKTMEIHVGTARLTLTSGAALEGHYYSGRGRREFGKLFLERAVR
jgi:hypothetical protein